MKVTCNSDEVMIQAPLDPLEGTTPSLPSFVGNFIKHHVAHAEFTASVKLPTHKILTDVDHAGWPTAYQLLSDPDIPSVLNRIADVC